MELETKVREDFKITETSSESYLYNFENMHNDTTFNCGI